MTLLVFQIALILVCFGGSAFFAGIETGIISINRLRLMHRARNGSKSARIIEGFLRQTDRLLGTTLIGNNIVNTIMATMAASIAEAQWGRSSQPLVGFGLAIAVLIFGEYLPKSWFTSHPLERCLPFARALCVIEIFVKPLADFIMKITQWTLPKKSVNGQRKFFVTREHLHLLTQDCAAGGKISTFERLMISRVLDMQVKTAAEIMTPIAAVARIQASATIAEAIALVRKRGNMKLPVFSEDNTQCIGVLYTQEVLAKTLESEQEPVVQHMKPAFFIPDHVRADDVLPLLRRNRKHIAMIRNAAGEILGIVTIENILKILVGNLPTTATGNRKNEPLPTILTAPPS